MHFAGFSGSTICRSQLEHRNLSILILSPLAPQLSSHPFYVHRASAISSMSPSSIALPSPHGHSTLGAFDLTARQSPLRVWYLMATLRADALARSEIHIVKIDAHGLPLGPLPGPPRALPLSDGPLPACQHLVPALVPRPSSDLWMFALSHRGQATGLPVP